MKKMNPIEAYTLAHKAKRFSKRIQQLSFSLNKIEQRFDLEKLTEIEMQILIENYISTFMELESIANELKNEGLLKTKN